MVLRAAHLRRGVIGLLLFFPLAGETLIGQTVRGTVAEETTGRPIPNAAVTVLDTAATTLATTLTNQEGRFTLAAPGPGVYFISVAAIGFERGLTGPLELAGGGDFDIELDLFPSLASRESGSEMAGGEAPA